MVSLGLGVVLGAIVLLLIFSAFFSGSETALTAASRARMHHLAEEGNKRARRVLYLTEDRERLIGAILLGNNLVNILASALATSLFLALFGDAGVVYATLVMTAVVLIFAEVAPKTFAITNTDRLFSSSCVIRFAFSDTTSTTRHRFSRHTKNCVAPSIFITTKAAW